MAKMKKYCETCMYFKDLNILNTENVWIGECRVIHIFEDRVRDDWCGEWDRLCEEEIKK